MFTHRVLWHFIAERVLSFASYALAEIICGQSGRKERQNKRELTMRMYNKCGKKRFSCTLQVILRRLSVLSTTTTSSSFSVGVCVCVWLLTFFFSSVDLLCIYCVCFFTLYFSLSLHCFVYFLFWRAVLANVCEHCNNNIESPAVDASLIARIFFLLLFSYSLILSRAFCFERALHCRARS